MISWLNKQLNEKPGSGLLTTGAPGSSQAPYSASKYSSAALPKPPISQSSSFKPTFASIEQLNSNSHTPVSSSFERSPYRTMGATSIPNHLNTPSAMSSISSSSCSTMQNPIALKNMAAPSGTFTYNPTSQGKTPTTNENMSSNIVPSSSSTTQPQFLSKYTQ